MAIIDAATNPAPVSLRQKIKLMKKKKKKKIIWTSNSTFNSLVRKKVTIVVKLENRGAKKTQTFLTSMETCKKFITWYKTADVNIKPGYMVPKNFEIEMEVLNNKTINKFKKKHAYHQWFAPMGTMLVHQTNCGTYKIPLQPDILLFDNWNKDQIHGWHFQIATQKTILSKTLSIYEYCVNLWWKLDYKSNLQRTAATVRIANLRRVSCFSMLMWRICDFNNATVILY